MFYTMTYLKNSKIIMLLMSHLIEYMFQKILISSHKFREVSLQGILVIPYMSFSYLDKQPKVSSYRVQQALQRAINIFNVQPMRCQMQSQFSTMIAPCIYQMTLVYSKDNERVFLGEWIFFQTAASGLTKLFKDYNGRSLGSFN